MLKNYITTAWRNMRRSGLYAAISIICLTLGITGAVLVTMYLNHELSYDTHHKHHESIYRMEGVYNMAGTTHHLAITPFPLGIAMDLEFSEVEAYTRFFLQEDVLVKVREDQFREDGFVYADSMVFDVFTHHFLHGQAAGALSEPNTVVLNRSLSKKYFGNENPVGKTLEINQETFTVTAVVEDLPDNTHFKYGGMLSMVSGDHEQFFSLNPELFWNININYTYLKLHKDHSMESLMEKMDAFYEKYVNPMGETFGASAAYLATPLRETHFASVQMAPESSSRATLLIFSVVALFLVIIASINYTNLSTARASKRSREIGIRKVSGASQGQLLTQFLSESILVAFVSLVFSMMIMEILLPFFNSLTGKTFSLLNLFHGSILAQVLLITLITGIAAGIYPALVLSRMNPSLIVKGVPATHGRSGLLRKVLVVFQFAISIVLVVGTLTVQDQLRFLQNKPLGFARENKAVISLQGAQIRQRAEAIENSIRQNPLVLNTAKSFSVPGRDHNLNAVKVETETEMAEGAIAVNYIDHQFVDMMEITLKEGRGFDRRMRAEAGSAALVNQSAVQKFGWHENPIGKQIQRNFNQEGQPQSILRVVGVLDDFHFLSLKNPIDPIMLILPENPSIYRYLVVEYLEGTHAEVIPFLESVIREFDQSRIPEIVPLTQPFFQEFEAEKNMGKVFGFFALITIIISFMGLFGLSSFTIEQRKKEIGIRKVLGSSSGRVLKLLFKEYSRLILIALLIASPVAWFLMVRWLEDFVYQISMSFAPIVIAGALAFAIAMATVSYHTLKPSRLNPVDTIRAE